MYGGRDLGSKNKIQREDFLGVWELLKEPEKEVVAKHREFILKIALLEIEVKLS